MQHAVESPRPSFFPVTRQKAKLRMALTGTPGSGKTLGALYIAFGITGDWSKIALIDTERERARMYANRSDLPTPTGAFLYCPLFPPYTPQAYRDLVAIGADAVGPDGVVIVDSFSHAWVGDGGVLDIKERIQDATPRKDGFSAWIKAGKEQTRLIDSILSADCHVICTMRSKMAYEVIEQEGKKRIVKLGLEPVQRGETEYEFDVVLDIQRENHIATASKDVTVLDTLGETITPQLGERLARWLAEGVSPSTDTCENCGSPIHGTEGRSADRIIQGTLTDTGRKLCMPCYREYRAKCRAKRTATSGSTVPSPGEVGRGTSVPFPKERSDVIPVTPRVDFSGLPPLPWEDTGYPFPDDPPAKPPASPKPPQLLTPPEQKPEQLYLHNLPRIVY